MHRVELSAVKRTNSEDIDILRSESQAYIDKWCSMFEIIPLFFTGLLIWETPHVAGDSRCHSLNAYIISSILHRAAFFERLSLFGLGFRSVSRFQDGIFQKRSSTPSHRITFTILFNITIFGDTFMDRLAGIARLTAWVGISCHTKAVTQCVGDFLVHVRNEKRTFR